jgi:hypothetical protein
MSHGIDTLKVGYTIHPSDIDLKGWHHTSHSLVKESDEEVYSDAYYNHFTAPNGSQISLKFIPNNYKGNTFNMLFIEFSLPKLILGCNHQDIEDWPGALRIANSVIATIPGLPLLPDIQDALLYRIDLCANLPVGQENVSDYIQALHKGCYPHRATKPYGKNGVMFTSQVISTCIYNKYQECGCDEAKGILRYEISMRKRWKISEWLDTPQPTLKDITEEIIRELLLKDMKTLHLDGHLVGDRTNAQAILKAEYSRSRVQNLLGYLEVLQTMTREQMKQDGYTSRSICYYERLLAEVGISSLSLESKKTLPALTLLLEQTGSEKNCHIVPSDTGTLDVEDTSTLDVPKPNDPSVLMIEQQRKRPP